MTSSSPQRMEAHEKLRLRAAAYRATRVYPGPVGELLSLEIMTWEEFGYRLGSGRLITSVVDHVLQAPLPERPATKSAVGYGV